MKSLYLTINDVVKGSSLDYLLAETFDCCQDALEEIGDSIRPYEDDDTMTSIEFGAALIAEAVATQQFVFRWVGKGGNVYFFTAPSIPALTDQIINQSKKEMNRA